MKINLEVSNKDTTFIYDKQYNMTTTFKHSQNYLISFLTKIYAVSIWNSTVGVVLQPVLFVVS